MADGASPQTQRAGDLYRAYGPAVYRRCLRLLHDREAARDATQEVFVKLVRDIAKHDDPDVVLPWIFRVATNHCLDVIRDRERHGEAELGERELGAAAPEARPEDRHLAKTLLSHFDGGTRAVAVSVLVDGMGREEAAGTLGISRKTVERRLSRFLERARKLLAGETGEGR